jgi:hypothetical protein
MRRAGPLLAASLAVALLGACQGDGNGAIEEPQAASDGATETTAPADLAEGKDFGSGETQDQRGTLLKRTGQWAGLRGEDDEVIDAAFRIVSIDPDLRCTAEDAQASVNGRFVGLEIEVETSATLGQTGSRATFSLHPEQFTAVQPDGSTVSRLLGESRGCLPREEYLPDAVTAGTSATGMLVLDVPEQTEAVVLEGQPFRSVRGWEWALP